MWLSKEFSLQKVDYVTTEPPVILKLFFGLGWKPRWGIKRKYISTPLMKIFIELTKLTNKLKIRINIKVKKNGNYIGKFSSYLDLQFFRVNRKIPNEALIISTSKLLFSNIECLIDIGSNIGNFHNQFINYPKIKIIAFEPQVKCNEIATKVSNLLEFNLTAIDVALSDDISQGYLINQFPHFSGYAKIESKENVIHRPITTTQISTLDYSLEKLNLKQIDLIKIDIEGYEFNCLKGATKTLKQFRPVVIYEDLGTLGNLGNTQNIVEYFKELDYVLFLPSWVANVQDEPIFKFYSPRIKGIESNLRIALLEVTNSPEIINRNIFAVLNLLAIPKEKKDKLLSNFCDTSRVA